jgi:hypothetical protein
MRKSKFTESQIGAVARQSPEPATPTIGAAESQPTKAKDESAGQRYHAAPKARSGVIQNLQWQCQGGGHVRSCLRRSGGAQLVPKPSSDEYGYRCSFECPLHRRLSQ